MNYLGTGNSIFANKVMNVSPASMFLNIMINFSIKMNEQPWSSDVWSNVNIPQNFENRYKFQHRKNTRPISSDLKPHEPYNISAQLNARNTNNIQ